MGAIGDKWTGVLVALAMDEVLPVGVVCRLRDAIRDADKAENKQDVWREEKEQRAEVRYMQDNTLLHEEVFVAMGKHTRAAVLSATLEGCL